MPSGGGGGNGDGDGGGGGDGAALHLSSQVLFKYVPLLLSSTHFLSLHVICVVGYSNFFASEFVLANSCVSATMSCWFSLRMALASWACVFPHQDFSAQWFFSC